MNDTANPAELLSSVAAEVGHTITPLKEAVELGKSLAVLHKVDGYKPVIVAPAMTQLYLAPEKLAAPRFLVASPTFHDPAAFVAYVNDFKDTRSRIFYSQDGKAVAVIDYHDDVGDAPAHGDHLAHLGLIRSPEWLAWSRNSEKQMTQQEFAEFLEDNLLDIIVPADTDGPDAAAMMEVAEGLNATSNSTFRQATNQANGSVNFAWQEDVQGSVGAGRSVPKVFHVGLRPFMGCNPYPVQCMLRYRVSGGKLSLHFKALRLEQITESALDGVVAKIAEGTGIAPALGAHDGKAFERGI